MIHPGRGESYGSCLLKLAGADPPTASRERRRPPEKPRTASLRRGS
jgi:hypothetical protein